MKSEGGDELRGYIPEVPWPISGLPIAWPKAGKRDELQEIKKWQMTYTRSFYA
jgi:hypothetical protein